MRAKSIKRYLRPYKIGSRKSTITHAFSAAIAPYDLYDAKKVEEAMLHLGQSVDNDLLCVYCGAAAQTWDHLVCTVAKRQFSGAGHRIGNLVPSCTACNTRKSNRPYSDFIASLDIPESEKTQKSALLDSFQSRFFKLDASLNDHPQHAELRQILDQVVQLMQRADEIAHIIRSDLLDPT